MFILILATLPLKAVIELKCECFSPAPNAKSKPFTLYLGKKYSYVRKKHLEECFQISENSFQTEWEKISSSNGMEEMGLKLQTKQLDLDNLTADLSYWKRVNKNHPGNGLGIKIDYRYRTKHSTNDSKLGYGKMRFNTEEYNYQLAQCEWPIFYKRRKWVTRGFDDNGRLYDEEAE